MWTNRKHNLAATCGVFYAETIIARGSINENNTFHIERFPVFTQPYPVCTWQQVMYTVQKSADTLVLNCFKHTDEKWTGKICNCYDLHDVNFSCLFNKSVSCSATHSLLTLH